MPTEPWDVRCVFDRVGAVSAAVCWPCGAAAHLPVSTASHQHRAASNNTAVTSSVSGRLILCRAWHHPRCLQAVCVMLHSLTATTTSVCRDSLLSSLSGAAMWCRAAVCSEVNSASSRLHTVSPPLSTARCSERDSECGVRLPARNPLIALHGCSCSFLPAPHRVLLSDARCAE